MKKAKSISKGMVLLFLGVLTILLVAATDLSAHQPAYTDSFMIDTCNGFSSTGTNPFFILQPGYRLVLRGEENSVDVRLTITVLSKTERVEEVTTRVVEERETHDGQIVEVSKNYFAICNRNNSVFYFGEDVDIYENGVIVSHDGSWRAGVNGARPGVMMPGITLIGTRYFQEVAPDVAMDRAEIMSLDAVVETPVGVFENCLMTKETTPLETGVREFKFYAPGIGLVQDGALKLTNVSN